MEDQDFQTNTVVDTSKGYFAPLKSVTPLSKYLALALFVVLPFLGGWIGYTYAPEKVVEVEKIVKLKQSPDEVMVQYGDNNNTVSARSYVVDEYIQLDIRPFSEKLLGFEIGAYRHKNDPFYTDKVNYNPDNGTINLDAYWSESSSELLLQLYPYDKSLDLEVFLEDLLLKTLSGYSDQTSEEIDRQNDQMIRELLIKEFPEADFSNITWRELCGMVSWEYNGVQYYSLDYDHDKYNYSALGSYCDVGTYEIHENILIHNPGRSIDATEPKVIRGSIKLLN